MVPEKHAVLLLTSKLLMEDYFIIKLHHFNSQDKTATAFEHLNNTAALIIARLSTACSFTLKLAFAKRKLSTEYATNIPSGFP